MPQPATARRDHLAPSRRGRAGDDPIFALNQEAAARKAKGESILNATVGVLLNDDGSIAVLPAAARAVKEVPTTEWAAYAPIAGSKPFLEAASADLLAARRDLLPEACAVATPGGSGALRHAFTAFLEPGQAVLTTSFYWGPYETIAQENERRVETFSMFSHAGGLDLAALDAAMESLADRQGRVLLVLNDPCHNPTGYSMDRADWEGAVEVLARHGERVPTAVVLDAAYSSYGPEGRGPGGGMRVPVEALAPLRDRVLLLGAWSASKAFTHYGLRVGALVAVVPDPVERREIAAALTFACRGAWSNCNRGGMHAVTRLLTDPALRSAVATEREALVRLLGERVDAFNREARSAGLRHPRYDGGFFTTVFSEDADESARRMREEGVFAVPVPGGVRLALSSVPKRDVPRLVASLARALR